MNYGLGLLPVVGKLIKDNSQDVLGLFQKMLDLHIFLN